AYAHEHFAAEERWMRELGYPSIEEHRAEHRRFLDVLEARWRGGPQYHVKSLPLASWLVRWLEEHVQRTDGAAARFAAAAATATGAAGASA
ncbi:MAG TPA: hemerythrin family protein, partial [Anaeromyxobacteraceae bacterium]|nr:hemerythrin family protein [Anaeromyxobacteraceae bacterium]